MSATKPHAGSLPPSYFEAKYKADIDPWRFRTSPYERDKYQATLGALSRSCYRSALEAGCAIGVFSALLAQRCERMVAVDSSPTAVDEAARQALPNVRFKKACLPDEFPDGTYDLIVLSEVLYYFSAEDLMRLADRCLDSLAPGGEMILCHWLGETDYPLTGRQASELFAEAVAKCRPTRVSLHEGIYRLERFSFRRSLVDDAK
jgi:SAM-dependent methyltransferase